MSDIRDEIRDQEREAREEQERVSEEAERNRDEAAEAEQAGSAREGEEQEAGQGEGGAGPEQPASSDDSTAQTASAAQAAEPAPAAEPVEAAETAATSEAAETVEVGEPETGADEAGVLREELTKVQEDFRQAQEEAAEMKDRFLRTRAELENYRRRAAAESDRARESGVDSAVMPILAVYDDLKRALEAAGTADPSQIIPGVEAVLSTLERNLDGLGIEQVGDVGDRFDPDLHEALTTVPTEEADQSETIAEVFQVGFRKGERLIRPARVVVYKS